MPVKHNRGQTCSYPAYGQVSQMPVIPRAAWERISMSPDREALLVKAMIMDLPIYLGTRRNTVDHQNQKPLAAPK